MVRGKYHFHPLTVQGITLSLIKAMQSYDPLKVTSHPKLNYVKQIMEGEALTNHQLFNFYSAFHPNIFGKVGDGPQSARPRS